MAAIPAILSGISALMPLVQTAIATISAFRGPATAAKVDSGVQDAIALLNAAMPLLEQFGSGKEVSTEDVRKALDGLDTQLDEFEKLIASKKAEGK